MIKDVKPTANENNDIDSNINELTEDIEVVSPGNMLREARQALSLTQEDIASKLNFKATVVNNIENDIFDPAIPVTFNRGYLVNYAKLVAVEVEDVLASYDVLGAASIQRTEMLSFSKATAQQAEHSRVMWLSYLIVAVLCGLTILWWLQDNRQQDESAANDLQPISALVESAAKNTKVFVEMTPESLKTEALVTAEQDINESKTQATFSHISKDEEQSTPDTQLSTAVFTFNGDCWVNIFDATGERIAWGVKKSGYVMTIQGKAPLRITVGKPELASIVFNGKQVDLSSFSLGNIAKFDLPLVAQ